MKVYNSNLP